MRRAVLLAALGGAGFAIPLPAQTVQRVHLLVVTGLSGERRYAGEFESLAGRLVEAARSRWGAGDSSVVWLAESVPPDPGRITGRATAAEVKAALARLGRVSRPGEVVLVVLFGHGSGEGPASRIGLPGPDLTARELALELGRLEGRTVVVVNTASGSGDFLAALSGPDRLIITATKSAFERNATTFAAPFIRGLADGEADADRDGRVTMLEAFTYARREVARAYESDGRLLTEHAQFDDDGNGKGSAEAAAGEGDGHLARRIALSLRAVAVSSDPRVAALEAERRTLEAAVADLRRRRAALDSLTYATELERLLLALAEKTRQIRELQEKKP